MITAVVGDIHGRYRVVDKVLDSYEHVVFVGDFMDSWYEPSEHQIRALVAAMEADNAQVLLGNHEASYLGPDHRCSGWDARTQQKFNQLRYTVDSFYRIVSIGPGVFVTHAGISLDWLRHVTGLPMVEVLELNHDQIFSAVNDCSFDTFSIVGKTRGGYYPFGGPLWCDWTDFQPIPGLTQIMGHTERRPGKNKGILIKRRNGNNYNIDCLGTAGLILEYDSNTGARTFRDVEEL